MSWVIKHLAKTVEKRFPLISKVCTRSVVERLIAFNSGQRKHRRQPRKATRAGEDLKGESALRTKWQQAGRKGAAGAGAVQR